MGRGERKRAHRNERGQGALEYGLIAALIALVVIGLLQVVGKQTNSSYCKASRPLGGAPTPGGRCEVVWGQSGGFTSNAPNSGGVTANSLSGPEDGLVDGSGNVYVVDTTNNRVLFYPSGSTTATRVYGQPDFASNAVNAGLGLGTANANTLGDPQAAVLDASGNLYVADVDNNRVLRYPPGSTTATGVYGQGGSFATTTVNKSGVSGSSLYSPAGMAVDSGGNLYVADAGNNRVLSYPSGSTTATRVYGQAGLGGSAINAGLGSGSCNSASLYSPVQISLDSGGNLYVADSGNNRVLFFPAGATTATMVYGQGGNLSAKVSNSGGVTANGLSGPYGVATESSGGVYVADTFNSRVLYYPAGTTTATRVYGQGGSFTSSASGVSADAMSWPTAVRLDNYGNLLVVDHGNNRVLQYTVG